MMWQAVVAHHLTTKAQTIGIEEDESGQSLIHEIISNPK